MGVVLHPCTCNATYRSKIVRKERTARGGSIRGSEDDRRMDWRVAGILRWHLSMVSGRTTRKGNGVSSWLSDREITIDGQPVCVSDAFLVLRGEE